MVHVVTVPWLAGTAMSPTVVGDDAESLVGEKEGLAFPAVGTERPAMAQRDDRAVFRTPVLVVEADAILGADPIHWSASFSIRRRLNCAGFGAGTVDGDHRRVTAVSPP